jgi:hypothetical protein
MANDECSLKNMIIEANQQHAEQIERICYCCFLDNIEEFQNLDDDLKTMQICKMAVEISGYDALPHCPVITEELCLLAVEDYGQALEVVPAKFKTKKVCMAAVANDGFALEYVPKRLQKDKDVYNLAISQNAEAAQCVN